MLQLPRRKSRKGLVVTVVMVVGAVAIVAGFAFLRVRVPGMPGLPMAMEVKLPMTNASNEKLSSKRTPSLQPVAPASKSMAETYGWQQDFTSLPSGPVDAKAWKFETGAGGWGNNELQYYTDRTQNARMENGKLVIEARREDYNGSQYTSARLTTKGLFQMQYGRIVFHDVVLPSGVGTWPALWMWPAGAKYSKTQMTGTGDEGLANGEIDIMEYVGAAPGEINSSAHAYAHYPGHGEQSGQTRVNDGLPHDYSLDWTADSLVFSVDDKPYYTLKNPHTGPQDWPYDQPYFVIVNLAMGGDWGGMASSKFPPHGIDNSKSSWKFSLGSITYYPLK